jgi:CelD/BcsL family acetyltransferase involved in cellulose biosynthesis
VGIAPFFKEKKYWLDVLPLRKLGVIGGESVTSEYQDVIVSRTMAKEARRAIWRYLSREWRSAWDVLSLSSVPELSPTLREMHEMPNALYIKLFDAITCHYAELPESYSEFLGLLTRKWRYTVRKKQRAISEAFQLQFVEAGESDEAKDMLRDLIALHRLGRRARGKKWSFRSDRFVNFVEEVCRIFVEALGLELHLLKANGQPISGLIGFRMNNKLFVYQQGIHPDYFRWSPGVVIFDHCIESAISKRIEEIDFLRGDDDYKEHWAKRERRSFNLWIVNRTLRGFVLAACLIFGQRFRSLVLKRVRSKALRF